MKYVYVVTMQTAMDTTIRGVYSSLKAAKQDTPADTIYKGFTIDKFPLKTLAEERSRK